MSVLGYSGRELLVNTTTSGNQISPSTALLANGNLVVVWLDAGDSVVRGQLFDALGGPLGSEFVASNTVGTKATPKVVGLSGGGFAVVWTDTASPSADGNGSALKGQLLGAAGNKVANEFLVNTDATGSQARASIAALANGGFVVGWDDGAINDQLFTVSGAKAGPEILADTFLQPGQVGGIQFGPAAVANAGTAALPNGGFFQVWAETQSGGASHRDALVGELFAPDGSKVGGPISFAQDTFNFFPSSPMHAGSFSQPAVTLLTNGNLVVTWSETTADSPDPFFFTPVVTHTTSAQLLSAAGSKIGTPILVSNTNNSLTNVVAQPNGGFVVTWDTSTPGSGDSSGTAIRAQAYDANGSAIGNSFLLNTTASGDQHFEQLTMLSNGRFLAAWQDDGASRGDTSGSGIKGQIFAQFDTLQLGDDDANSLTGTAGTNSLRALAGNDVLNGAGGADDLGGGVGDDKFVFDAAALADARAASPIFDRVSDYRQGNTGSYSAAESDQIDLSALVAAALNLGNGQPVSSLVRAVERFADTFAKLQIDTDGAANGATWTDIARLDGMRVGDGVNVIVDPSQPAGATITVMELVPARPTPHDFDGDARADILWRHNNGTANVFLMNGATVLNGSNTTLQVDNNWTAQDKADFNGDGRADVLWRHLNGTSNIFLMDGAVVIGGSNISLQVDNNWTVQGAGDFNGDGNADILWRHQNGTANVFLMDAATVVGGANTTAQVDNNWTMRGIGDFNGDGRSDILWRHANGTANVFLMDGAFVTGGSNTTQQVDNNWSVKDVGDFNGDGKADILWRHQNGTANVFLMNGSTVIGGSNTTLQVDNNWSVADTGDYNGDGKTDILWRHQNGTTNVFLMDGATVIGGSNTTVQVDNNWHVV